MNLGKTFYAPDRKQWRSWLAKNHDKEKEIWLVYYRKISGKARIPYNDAVEEALCYGWIDSTVKPIDEKKFAQRFTPRRPKSRLSELNKERIRKMIAGKSMTSAGLNAVRHAFDENQRFTIANDLLKALRHEDATWRNFQEFPDSYKRVRISWIESARTRPEVFDTRLRYFLRMTAKNKKYGMLQQ